MLIIDDSPDSREYLQACLEGGDYEVELASGGEEGLKKAKVFIPSAVLLGLSTHGVEVCRELKSDPITAQAAVIVISAEDDDHKLKNALEAGADDVEKVGDAYQITCAPTDFYAVKGSLEAGKLALDMAEITRVPSSTIKLGEEDGRKILALLEAIEEHDDVENTYANFDLPDALVSELSTS